MDSSTALALLREQGHELTAFYLKIWLEEEMAGLGHCPFEEDLGYVRGVCTQFGVPLEILSLQKEYYEQVVHYTVEELRAGRTPSPDLLCNRRIKFGEFVDRAGIGFDRVATGHYARTRDGGGYTALMTSPDPVKDQTYFLARLTQLQLGKALFPIGHLLKRQVRALAARLDLSNKERRDSQGICFLGKIRFRDFVKFYLGENPGDILEQGSGRRLGRHQGYWFYTIGQREGLGLAGGPWYVTAKDTAQNIVYVAAQADETARRSQRFGVEDLHWISGNPPAFNKLEVKIRHGARRLACSLERDADRCDVVLEHPEAGVAAGQFAVFYLGEECLGSGVIA